MRGKVTDSDLAAVAFRITPAYAGKRIYYRGSQIRPWDHPRLCGEKAFSGTGMLTFTGSPPPMRGKVHRNPLRQLHRRITPAYAGKRFGTAA